MSKLEYMRGSIWYCGLPGWERSSIQRGYRPVVIVSSLMGCMTSDFVIVAPFTTQIKDLSVNVNVTPFNEVPTQVLTNQLMTVPKSALSKPCGILDEIDMHKVETGILVSLGLAKPVVDNIKATQDALATARKDREELEKMIPQAKDLVSQLNELIQKVQGSNIKTTKTGRVKRSPEVISSFCREWADPSNDRKEVISAFGFNSYNAAYLFYQTHKSKVSNG